MEKTVEVTVGVLAIIFFIVFVRVMNIYIARHKFHRQSFPTEAQYNAVMSMLSLSVICGMLTFLSVAVKLWYWESYKTSKGFELADVCFALQNFSVSAQNKTTTRNLTVTY
jgi:hypothetical protein